MPFGYQNATPERQRSFRLFVSDVIKRLGLAALFALVAMFLFIKLAYEMRRGDTFRTDHSIVQYFQVHQLPLLHELMLLVSWVAGPICQGIVVVVAIILFTRARLFWPNGFSLLVGILGGLALSTGLKFLFHRPRPEDPFVEAMKNPGFSFPSGHSFFALVVYGMLAYWLTRNQPARRWMWPVAIFSILLVGFSRVFLGAHYPSDILGGFTVALPWLWGCLTISSLFHREVGEPAGESAEPRLSPADGHSARTLQRQV